MDPKHMTWKMRWVRAASDEVVVQIVCDPSDKGKCMPTDARTSYMSEDMVTDFLGHYKTDSELVILKNNVKPMLISYSTAPDNLYFKLNPNYIAGLVTSDCNELGVAIKAWGVLTVTVFTGEQEWKAGTGSKFMGSEITNFDGNRCSKTSWRDTMLLKIPNISAHNNAVKNTNKIALNSYISIRPTTNKALPLLDTEINSTTPIDVRRLIVHDDNVLVWAISNIAQWNHTWCPFDTLTVPANSGDAANIAGL